MYTQEIVCPRCGKMTTVNVPDVGSATTPCQRTFCSAKIVISVDKQGKILKIGTDSCIIATACFKVVGDEDDCRELDVLREFRDWYMRERPEAAASISEYYAIAPVICQQINSLPNHAAIWRQVVCDVRRAVDLVESGKRDQAIACYQHLLDGLKSRFLSAAQS
jgi:hypothetical protein